jgi:predicted DCC family thiol-disulfide oxidoreductase YuxK
MPWLLITALLIWWVGVVEQLATPSPWRDGFMFLSGIGWGALAILYRAAPRVPPAYPDRIDWLFYDGYCGLCHGAVRTVLAEDRLTRKRKQGAFKLCPQQAPAFERQLNEKTRSSLPDSVIVLTKKGDLITRSEATRYIFLRLGGIWRLIGHFLWLVPRPLRDAAYGLIARWRYRLFGKAEQVCPMMPPRYRKRFVLD